MKKLNEIGSNRIFKIVGLTVVLYLIFFSKENPSSLRNKISISEIKDGAHQIKEKADFIRSNLKTAQEITSQKPDEKTKEKETVATAKTVSNTPSSSTTNPVEATNTSLDNASLVSDKNYKIVCGDEVEISYSITLKNEKVGPEQKQKLIIGSNNNYIMESGVIGSKLDEDKTISIPEKIEIRNNKNGPKLVPTKSTEMGYLVKIISIKKAVKPDLTCY